MDLHSKFPMTHVYACNYTGVFGEHGSSALSYSVGWPTSVHQERPLWSYGWRPPARIEWMTAQRRRHAFRCGPQHNSDRRSKPWHNYHLVNIAVRGRCASSDHNQPQVAFCFLSTFYEMKWSLLQLSLRKPLRQNWGTRLLRVSSVCASNLKLVIPALLERKVAMIFS